MSAPAGASRASGASHEVSSDSPTSEDAPAGASAASDASHDDASGRPISEDAPAGASAAPRVHRAAPSSIPLPAEAYLASLAGFPGMGPRRMRRLLAAGTAADAWALAAGHRQIDDTLRTELGAKADAILEEWRSTARRREPAAVWQAHRAAGIGITMLGSTAMPRCLAHDLEPPVVLFHTGDLDRLAGPRVAIVGTRRATRYGLDVAAELGRELTQAGVLVVSGLATGIDAAAHRGALSVQAPVPPVAVVGSGPDTVYPRHNRNVWEQVAASGLLLSEYPLGTKPAAWHFPARNRLVAALADVVVVVESAVRGGSMYTVEEAERRDVPVLAVPGSVRSRVSAGTNALLAAGHFPCCGVEDVLGVLGLQRATVPDPDAPPVPAELRPVLDALEWQPVTFDDLLERTGSPAGELAAALSRLVGGGWLSLRGGWYERVVVDR